jgi:hypothetical protein
MQFRVRRVESEGITYTEVSIQKNEREAYRLWNLEDSVPAWRAGCIAMAEDERRGKTLEWLAASVPELLNYYSENMEAPRTFLNMVRALFDFLERKEGQELRSRYPKAYPTLLHFLFKFKACRELPCYIVEFRLEQELVFYHGYATPEHRWTAIPKNVCAGIINHKLQEDQSNREHLQRIIENYEHFCDVVQEVDAFTLKSFANFSKALVELIERDSATFGFYTAHTSNMCAFIVKNEYDSVEEQKLYLGHILNSREEEEDKAEQLSRIVDDVKEDIKRAKKENIQGTPKENGARLATIISLIAEYYLSIYDLEQAVNFWNKTEKKDWLLRILLSIYKSPGRYFIASVTFFLFLVVLAVANVHESLSLPLLNFYIPLGAVKPYIPWLTVLAMVPVYGGVVLAFVWGGYVLLGRKELYYTQLFLPRLLGAIVVGLTALLVQDTPWRLGMSSELLNLGLACLIAYALSFLYIFIDVYNTIKFLRSSPKHGESIIQRAIAVSRKIFLIGVMESFLAVLLASTIFYSAIGLDLYRDKIGGVIFSPGAGLSFGLFPALVTLWTGVALFIGAFVQLIWQDKRITAPV